MTPSLNDASRLSQVYELLPESFVEDFVNYRLFNGRYPTDYIGVLDTFANRMDEVALEFSNSKTRRSFERLKRDFRALNSFLIAHFSIPTGHYKMHRDPPFLYLEPVIHHNFRISEGGAEEDRLKDSEQWDQYKAELDDLGSAFYSSYREFLRTAHRTLEAKPSAFGSGLSWLGENFVIKIIVGGTLLIFGSLWTAYINQESPESDPDSSVSGSVTPDLDASVNPLEVRQETLEAAQ